MSNEQGHEHGSEQPESEKLGRSQPARLRVNWGRLAIKELRETLRDRRTIVTLILMPLLVYPILSLVFRTFLASNAALFSANGEPIVFQIVYDGEMGQKAADQLLSEIGQIVTMAESKQRANDKRLADALAAEQNSINQTDEPGRKPAIGAIKPLQANERRFAEFQQQRWMYLTDEEEATFEEVVVNGSADAGLYFVAGKPEPEIRILSRDDAVSRTAARYLREKLALFNSQMLERLLVQSNLPTEPALKVVEQPVQQEGKSTGDGFSLASLIPLVLVLMTITGAVYPAIDLTAGEKERGTLETLMAAPISRLSILSSKFAAVLTVAVLTAVLNMIGMAATVWAFQLDQFLSGSNEFTLVVILKIFALLVLFAAFFSALLLAVTSYARSFKEAQAYLIPIILLSLGPGLLAMTPGLELKGLWVVTPMVNILLLARDVIENQVEIVPATIAILSTALYAVAAIVLAARSFGSDSILYSTHGSFGEMFSRPRKSSVVVPVAAAIICVVLLFPINFLMIGFLGRLPAETTGELTFRFMMMGVFTAISFFVIPALIAIHQKTDIKQGFGVRSTRVLFFIGAILLGISLWPIVISMVEGWHSIYGWFAGEDVRDSWRQRLVAESTDQVTRIRQMSPLLIGLCFSLIPAVCEEWFFRGMLLRSLLTTKKVWQAIILSAVVFGLFHVLSGSVIALDRLIPTTLVGIALGYLAYKSDSILPGIILHALHNAAVVFLAYYQPKLSQFSWFPGENDPVPQLWVFVAIVVSAVGMILIFVSKSDDPGTDNLEETNVAELV